MRLLKPLQISLAVLLALGAVGAMVMVYLTQGLDQWNFFNSDALYLPALYYDLFERGGRLRHWFLTPAPYFVPDMPLYFGMRWLAGNVYDAVAAFMAAQALMLWALTALLARRYTALPSALAVATLGTAVVCQQAAFGNQPYNFVMMSGFHFGTFLMMLLALALLLPLLEQGARARRAGLAALALLTAATVLSDRLFVPHFVLPSVVASVLLYRRFPGWRRLCLVLLCACVAGVLLYHAKALVGHKISMPFALSIHHIDAKLRELGAVFALIRAQSPLLACYLLVFHAALLALAPGTLLGRGWRLSDPHAAWLAIFALCGSAGMLVASVLSSAPVTVRYLVPLLMLPIVLGPVIAYAQWRQRLGARSQLLALAASTALVWPLAVMMSRAGPVRHAYYPDEVACIDRVLAPHDVRHGVAGYWQASWLTMNSRYHPRMAALEGNMAPYEWITTLDNFRDRYDFAVVTGNADPAYPSEAQIVALNGAPMVKATCGPLIVLVYPRDAVRVR